MQVLQEKIEHRDISISIKMSLFHLAVLEDKPESLRAMLNKTKSSDRASKIMEKCINIDVGEEMDKLEPEDIVLHRQNIFHLATEYSSDCLEILLFETQFDKVCLDYRKLLQQKDHFERTPLHHAASNLTLDCASKIFDCTHDPNTLLKMKDYEGNNPVHIVSMNGTEETLYLFINAVEDKLDILNAHNNKGKAPIFYARTPKMSLMLSTQPEVNCFELREREGKKEENVLESLLKNNVECAKSLLTSAVMTNNKPLSDKDLLIIYNLNMLTKQDEEEKVNIFPSFSLIFHNPT